MSLAFPGSRFYSGFFYTFRVFTSTPFYSWPLHSNWLRASSLASTGSSACPKAFRSLRSLAKSANCLPQTLPNFFQIPGALTGNERESCCCALTSFSDRNGHLPHLSYAFVKGGASPHHELPVIYDMSSLDLCCVTST
jgi:hypothetical protein